MARLLNKFRDTIPPDAISIMRPGIYGNPFTIGRHGDRKTVVQLFREQALPLMNLKPLRGADLICCCAPLLCHGDTIMEKLYGPDWRTADS